MKRDLWTAFLWGVCAFALLFWTSENVAARTFLHIVGLLYIVMSLLCLLKVVLNIKYHD